MQPNIFNVQSILVETVVDSVNPYSWKPQPRRESVIKIGEIIYKCCPICHSYYEEVKSKLVLNNTFFSNSCQQVDEYHHLRMHPESYLVKIPVDKYFGTLEEVISHFSRMGFR